MDQLEPLLYKGNEQSKLTLHLILQIIGKIRMSKTPRKNHWWYITEYIDTRGFTTGPIPHNNGFDLFTITLDVIDHELKITTSLGKTEYFNLGSTTSVASFYNDISRSLKHLKIPLDILDRPFDLDLDHRFSDLDQVKSYNPEYTVQLWRTMLWVGQVFQEFGGRFYGKTCPVHLYWHSMDLTITRFSGNEAPSMPQDARLSDKDAYSHEVISFGFWPGDYQVPEPAFYSYTHPSPKGLDQKKIEPHDANWVEVNGSPMAILKYNDLIKYKDPNEVLLKFLESTYQAGASLANWDIDKFEVPDLDDL
ncbi:MAG: DUF5996 family protein [Nonlabens sp.]